MRSRTMMSVLAGAMLATAACDSNPVKQAEEAQQRAEALAAEAVKAAEAARQAAEAAHAKEAEDAPGGTAAEPANLQDALAQIERTMKGNLSNVEPVDFRKLKAMLPEALDDMKRVDFSGQKSGAMGMKLSMAEAKFKGTDGGSVDLKIVDMGSMKGFAAIAATGWATIEIDKESDSGFEKTGKFEGYRSYEKHNTKTKRSELKLVIAGRFMVEGTGRKVAMDTVRAAVKKIPLGDLEALKTEGLGKAAPAPE